MTADGKINLDMLIRVAADQARREVKEFFAEVRAGTSEAKNLGSASAAATAPLDRLGAGAKSAAEPFNVLAANITRTEAEFSSYIATLGAAAVSVAGTRDAMTGLTASIGTQTQELIEGATASRAYQATLDTIRASYNPLFAASRQYELQLERIEDALGRTAISEREAAAAREAAAQQYLAPVQRPGPRGGAGPNPYTANIGAQGFDIGVTAAMGMNPLMIGLQQGSQLAGIAQQMGGG
ncbi:hypothetical protein, partial [uncultured Gemmobacter sp.]|uniref:hypothetical protein n=1 Tax=uncultured Gemmobacter sp. TaxID=1095917 RepID=UPI00259177DD